jgi:plastocyanin
MRRGTALIIAVIIIIAAVAAFALTRKDNTNNTTTTKPSTTNQQSSPSTSSKPASNTPVSSDQVTIENEAFTPSGITVKKGTKVTWTNKDSMAHTVTGDTPSGPNSQTLNQGDAYSFTFDSTGTFKYHCNFHSFMTGTVTVTE